jgi:hypothetical protein
MLTVGKGIADLYQFAIKRVCIRLCEERRDEAIQSATKSLDCFASLAKTIKKRLKANWYQRPVFGL